MKPMNVNTRLIDTYFGLIKNLSSEGKQELIARISKSINKKKDSTLSSIDEMFGAFVSDKSADEIIQEIQSSRTFSRTTEQL